jgi:uncharacterized protein (UPF0335 family)
MKGGEIWPAGLLRRGRAASVLPYRCGLWRGVAMQQEVSQSDIQRSTQAQLKSIIERIERLEEEKKALSSDIKDIFSEAKATGFDIKALRRLIRIRKQDKNERQEEEAILALYMSALGME